MRATATTLPGVVLIEPAVHQDQRGFFFESFNLRQFKEVIGHDVVFVQDNHSRSTRGVLRGLHYQVLPHAQGKLVRVARGVAFDVAVDIRRSSATYGRWVGFELSDQNQRQVWIPPGFAHGFMVLSDVADFLYKTTDYYAPECEGSIRWDDPGIGIAWPLASGPPVVSQKDGQAPLLSSSRPYA